MITRLLAVTTLIVPTLAPMTAWAECAWGKRDFASTSTETLPAAQHLPSHASG